MLVSNWHILFRERNELHSFTVCSFPNRTENVLGMRSAPELPPTLLFICSALDTRYC